MSRPQELGHWRGTGLREFSKCCKYHVSNQDGPSMMLVLVASLLWFFVPSARGSCGWVSVWLRKNWFVSHLSFILLCADFFQYYFSFPQYYGIKCRKTLSKNFLLPSLNWTTVWVASPIVWLHLSGAIDPCVEPAKSQCMAHRYHPTGEGFPWAIQNHHGENPWDLGVRMITEIMISQETLRIHRIHRGFIMFGRYHLYRSLWWL